MMAAATSNAPPPNSLAWLNMAARQKGSPAGPLGHTGTPSDPTDWDPGGTEKALSRTLLPGEKVTTEMMRSRDLIRLRWAWVHECW